MVSSSVVRISGITLGWIRSTMVGLGRQGVEQLMLALDGRALWAAGAARACPEIHGGEEWVDPCPSEHVGILRGFVSAYSQNDVAGDCSDSWIRVRGLRRCGYSSPAGCRSLAATGGASARGCASRLAVRFAFSRLASDVLGRTSLDHPLLFSACSQDPYGPPRFLSVLVRSRTAAATANPISSAHRPKEDGASAWNP